MRVFVVGGGVIGSLFAAHLARVSEVWVLTRREGHAEALNRDGLRVSGKSEFVAELSATANPEELPPFELAIVCTKATDLDSAIARMARSIPPSAVMMTTQNGLGAETIIQRHGSWEIIAGVTFMSGIRHSDTYVEYELDTPTWIGPGEPAPSWETVVEVAELIEKAGLKVQAMEDVRPAQWSKLIFNATVNVVSALTELSHNRHFREEDQLWSLGHLVHELMEEGKQVADAAGIALYEDPWEMNLHAVRRGETDSGAYRHLPSMLEDVLARRPTEVDFITGELVKTGIRYGVSTPLHLALYRLIKAKESAWVEKSSPTLSLA